MGGKKGQSGPVGNLNAARYPWRAFWKRRALRREDQWVATEVANYAADLVSDRPNPTEGERRCIELAAEAKCARLLIWKAIKEGGFTRVDAEGLTLSAAAEALPRFIGAELGALKLLGLERRAKPVKSLQEYISESQATGNSHEED
jgi:hypothetical protein